MKKIRLAVLTIATLTGLVAAFLVGANQPARNVHAAGGGCPADYAAGFYGFSGQAQTIGFAGARAPYANAGAIFLTSDGTGLLTGTIGGYQTINKGGTVTRTDFSGTFAMVASHCYGSATIIPTVGPTTHYDLVPVGWSLGGMATEVLFVETDTGGIGTFTALHM